MTRFLKSFIHVPLKKTLYGPREAKKILSNSNIEMFERLIFLIPMSFILSETTNLADRNTIGRGLLGDEAVANHGGAELRNLGKTRYRV